MPAARADLHHNIMYPAIAGTRPQCPADDRIVQRVPGCTRSLCAMQVFLISIKAGGLGLNLASLSLCKQWIPTREGCQEQSLKTTKTIVILYGRVEQSLVIIILCIKGVWSNPL